MIKNDLIIRTLRGEPTERTPVWMMRQAGRYLPDYRILRDKYDFFTRVQTPALATEITLQPVDQIGVDAAILFSDILVVLQAMGLEVQLIENKGPILPDPVRSIADLKRVFVPDTEESLGYVFDAIRLTKQELNNRVPLIGFAGAPWTLLCYMVEGKGSKTFDSGKVFLFYPTGTCTHAIANVNRYNHCLPETTGESGCRYNSAVRLLGWIAEPG